MIRKPLPPPTLSALYPPVRGYAYFDAAAAMPFGVEPGAQTRPTDRWWLAEHALLSYDDAPTIERNLAAHGYRCVCLSQRSSSTFVYAAIASDHGVLAFRGTEVLTPGDSLFKLADVARDWFTDARAARVPFDGGGRVHAGFAAALDSIWPALEPLLSQAPRWYCTGHSLGGALAALSASRMHRRGVNVAALATFGQPRTGDAQFTASLAGVLVTRVVNACDLVPRMPPEALGFQHGGDLVHLDARQFETYGATLRAHVMKLPQTIKHGIGALTPIELIDHAPLYYAIKCFNATLDDGRGEGS